MSKLNSVGVFLRRAIVAALVLTTSAPSMLNAQEAETKEAADTAKSDEAKEAEEEKPLFEVPEEGTVDEYFAFINKVKRTRAKARDREGMMAHMELQIQTVLQVCDKIMETKPESKVELRVINEKFGALGALARANPKLSAEGMEKLMAALEADTRPEIISLLTQKKLEAKAASISRMSSDEQAAFVEECFAVVEKSGLDRGMYGVLSGIGRTLGRSESPEVGVALYKQLADAMEKSDDPTLSERAERMRGSARRLELPGNFMEIVGTTAEGEEFDWTAYRGKVVLVDFWASWCGPCRAEIPNMKKQLDNYSARGFEILGVNLDNTKAAYQKYVDDQELTWTNLMSDKKEEMGWNNPLAAHYGVSGIPTAILVDKEGKVVSMSARGTRLNKLLEDLLGPVEEEPKETPETAKDATE